MWGINLQLFGGGGSKSGLGGGGSGNTPTHMYYTYSFKKRNGDTSQKKTFKAKNREEADKKAEKYKNEEGYIGKSKNPTIRTPEEYDAFKNKTKSKK